MTDRVDRLADVLVAYSGRVRSGDLALVYGPSLAAPLLRALYRRLVAAGAHPYVKVDVEGVLESRYRDSTIEQLEWVSPIWEEEMERVDVRFAIGGEWNTKTLSSADPAKQAASSRAHQHVRKRFLERAAAGEVRWVVTDYPSQAAAQDAEMSLEEYERFVERAAFLDDPDPVARWEAFGEELRRLVDFLSGIDELRFVADGTDLRVGVGGRTWVPSDGHENFPDGEVFTGPVEDRVDGTIRFSYPAIFHLREVEGVRLRFERGEVVDAAATRGQDFLRRMIAMDEGSRRVGELAFGLNEAVTEFTRSILFDEKIGGTVHLALGQSYPETGGRNDSGLHWDMICDLRDGGEVYADGELVYRDGRFLAGAVPSG